MAERDALGALSPDQRERLEAVVVDLGYDRGRPLPRLVQGWADHVHRLVSERDVDPDEGSRWTPHDFVAALLIRDFVELGLRGLPEDLTAAAHLAVDPVDAAFSEFTAPDTGGLLAGWLPAEDIGDGWWWRRVPVAGPVAHDLLEARGRSP